MRAQLSYPLTSSFTSAFMVGHYTMSCTGPANALIASVDVEKHDSPECHTCNFEVAVQEDVLAHRDIAPRAPERAGPLRDPAAKPESTMLIFAD